MDPAEICGLAGDRLYQRQERYPFGPCLWREEAQFHGPALLGEGIFCLDGWSRRNCDTGIHQEAGGRGQPPRSTEHVALKATFRWPTEPGSRQRPQRAALSGPKPKAPGFAGGYLPIVVGLLEKLRVMMQLGAGSRSVLRRNRIEPTAPISNRWERFV